MVKCQVEKRRCLTTSASLRKKRKKPSSGFLHNVRPTSTGTALLNGWEIEYFQSHLDKAEGAKIQNIPIWPVLKAFIWLKGHSDWNLKRLEDEWTIETVFS